MAIPATQFSRPVEAFSLVDLLFRSTSEVETRTSNDMGEISAVLFIRVNLRSSAVKIRLRVLCVSVVNHPFLFAE
jgi:hypothetical protein